MDTCSIQNRDTEYRGMEYEWTVDIDYYAVMIYLHIS